MTRFIQASIAALLVSAAAAQAFPELTYSEHSMTVSYHPSTEAAVVLARIEDAAQRVCGSRVEAGNYYTQEEAAVLNKSHEACIVKAISKAVAATNSPAIADLYAKQASAAQTEQVAGR